MAIHGHADSPGDEVASIAAKRKERLFRAFFSLRGAERARLGEGLI